MSIRRVPLLVLAFSVSITVGTAVSLIFSTDAALPTSVHAQEIAPRGAAGAISSSAPPGGSTAPAAEIAAQGPRLEVLAHDPVGAALTQMSGFITASLMSAPGRPGAMACAAVQALGSKWWISRTLRSLNSSAWWRSTRERRPRSCASAVWTPHHSAAICWRWAYRPAAGRQCVAWTSGM